MFLTPMAAAVLHSRFTCRLVIILPSPTSHCHPQILITRVFKDGQGRQPHKLDGAEHTPLMLCPVALVETAQRLAIKNYVTPRLAYQATTSTTRTVAITDGCTLMEIIYANRLHNYKAGVAKTTKQLSEEAWECHLKEPLRIKRCQRWWSAARCSPHACIVHGKEAWVLMWLVGGPESWSDKRATTALVLRLIIPSSVLRITEVRGIQTY